MDDGVGLSVPDSRSDGRRLEHISLERYELTEPLTKMPADEAAGTGDENPIRH
jgi:hypothetical protein